MKRLFIVALALISAVSINAQIAMPHTGATAFKDTSMLKPPAGAKVAIVEFEDLECPKCAYEAPIVRAAIDHYQIAYLHHDFIISYHTWSREAAITARYLQDKVSPKISEQFRLDIFANQKGISSKDDLVRFTLQWFRKHNLQMPFVVDPSGNCAKEVQADCTLGEHLGVAGTPTIVVVTAHQWIEVTDVNQLYAAIDRAESAVGATTIHAQPSVRKQ
ncbi:MAG: thioredoxin domain-containing protein [Terracidiphilus sp.]|jgi:protein-disulfide isomerase